MKMQDNPRGNERGSALLWVFIAIALFAGLSMVLNQGGQSGEGALNKEQAGLAATDIINYGNALRSAVQQLQINGCADTQISFAHSLTGAAYDNLNAPEDNRCHVLHPDGGGMSYRLPPENYFNQNRYIGFDANHCVDGIGADGACGADTVELIMSVYALNEDICIAINTQLGIDNPSGRPPDDSSSHATSEGNGFAGTYAPAGLSILGDGGSVLYGKSAGCYKDTDGFSNQYYIFYQVLIAR